MPSKSKTSAPSATDQRFSQAVQNYEAAIRALFDKKYDKAQSLFEKVLSDGTPELADRARIHLSTAKAQAEQKTAAKFNSTEEQYDYAISLMNRGEHDQARQQFEQLVKKSPQSDYVHYGLAILSCQANRVEEALRHLGEAIKLNPQARYQARNDSDFQNMADDPRFTELLYPEPAS